MGFLLLPELVVAREDAGGASLPRVHRRSETLRQIHALTRGRLSFLPSTGTLFCHSLTEGRRVPTVLRTVGLRCVKGLTRPRPLVRDLGLALIISMNGLAGLLCMCLDAKAQFSSYRSRLPNPVTAARHRHRARACFWRSLPISVAPAVSHSQPALTRHFILQIVHNINIIPSAIHYSLAN